MSDDMKTAYDALSGCWCAFGDGPLRYITVEANTRQGAEDAFTSIYANQFYHMESMTHLALSLEEGYEN